jgi:L-iditol 2-dehydrogenase
MRTVRAAVISEVERPIELREVPVPELERNSALIRVALREVCGTDVYLHQGRLEGVPYPLIPGHVSVGFLEEIRGSLKDVEGRPLSEGDPVTFLDVHRTCFQCWHCLVAKASTRCPDRKVYGITYGLDDGPSGGWAEAIYLKPKTRILRLEEQYQERFMAGGCGLPTAIHAVERAQIELNEFVLVLGSGPVGLSAVALSRMKGAGKIICIGAPNHRLKTALDAGADVILNIEEAGERERQQRVFEETLGRGADVTIEATGNPLAVVQAMRSTRDAGRVVVVGQYTDHGEISFNPHSDLNRKHLDVLGCWGSDFSHFHRAVGIMKDEKLCAPWESIPLTRFSLEQCNEALDSVATGPLVKALIDPAL